MSLAQTRQDFADALSTVAGIHGYAQRPTALSDGDAWPQWAGYEYSGGHVYTAKWNIMIMLPQADDVTADHFTDEHVDALIAALRPVLFVDAILPAKLDIEGGVMYALMISGRSE